MLVYAAAAASSASDEKQLPLPQSKSRTWRLPGLPANGAFVRVLECEYAHKRVGLDGMRGYAPGWKGLTNASSRMPRLQTCIADEMSRWYHGVPAAWVKPDISSLWYSHNDVLQADGEVQGAPLATYPTSRLMGFVISPNVTIDAAYPHDTWMSQPINDYSLCNKSHSAGHSSEAYAKTRFANLRTHCDALSKLSAHRKRKQAGEDVVDDDNDGDDDVDKLEMQSRMWPSSWIRESGETCHHGSLVARAEADQRAFLRLLLASPKICDPGPIYNQVQVRYSVGMITGIFYTPELRVEAEMARSAIESVARAFGRQQSIDLVEARWIGAESESVAHERPTQPQSVVAMSQPVKGGQGPAALEPDDWMAEEARLGRSTRREEPEEEEQDDGDDE